MVGRPYNDSLEILIILFVMSQIDVLLKFISHGADQILVVKTIIKIQFSTFI